MASSPPVLTPEQIAQLQRVAQSGGLSSMFAPSVLSPLDPLYDYAKTAPILSLTGNKEYENLNFQALPDTQYRLTVGGQVIGSAATPQEVARLVDQANAISKQGGAKVDVRLQKEVQAATPTGEPITAFEDVYANKENNTGALGTLLPAALAAISGGALGPVLGGIGGVSNAVGTGIAAGLGSTAGSLGTGSSLKDALVKGAISGLTAGVMSGTGLDDAIGNAFSSKGGSLAGQAAGQAATSFPGEIVVTGVRNALAPAISGLAGSALSTGIGNIGTDPFQQAVDQARLEGRFGPAPEADLITVSSGRSPSPSLSGGIGGAAPSGFDQFLSDNAGMVGDTAPAPAETEEPGVTAEASRLSPSGLALAVPALAATAALASGAGGGLSSAGQQAMESDLTQSQRAELQTQAGSAPAAGSSGILKNATLGNVLLNAPQILGGLGALLGGGGGGGTGGIGAGFDQGLSYQPLSRTLRPTTFDPFTYGQTGGEFRFFNDQGPQLGIGGPAMIAPPPPEPVMLARGGMVKGIGGGQDDLIDAKLSDGEYVLSAQDVSDLGDGSNDEGARRLDEMRKLIRKNAGRRNTKTIAKPQKSVSSLLRAVK